MNRIVTIPEEVLSQKAKAVVEGEDVDWIKRLLLEGLEKYRAVGLAATQMAILKRVIALRLSVRGLCENVALVNPRLTYMSPETFVATEGCLSIPGVRLPIERSQVVTVAHDLGEYTFSGINAVVAQHEIDHLDGKLITDRAAEQLAKLRMGAPAAVSNRRATA